MAGSLIAPRLRAVGLVLPLVAFIGASFVAPLVTMLSRSVYDPVVAAGLPETLALLQAWDGEHLPPERVFETAGRELLRARRERTIGRIALRINRLRGGLLSVMTRTARELRRHEPERIETWRAGMTGIHPAWGEVQTWQAIRHAGERFTARHYLHAPGPGARKRRPYRSAPGRVSRLSAAAVAYPGREPEPDRGCACYSGIRLPL